MRSEKQELLAKFNFALEGMELCLSDFINFWVTRSVEQDVDDTAYKRVYALYDAARRTGLIMEEVYALWLASSGMDHVRNVCA